MSRLQKGLLALAIAFVAVIAVGYAGMRYLENSVVDAVRAWAATTPENRKVTLGDVRYSLKDNVLFFGNAKLSWSDPEENINVSIESLEIKGIGDSFLALLKNPGAQIKEAELLVANTIVAKGIDTEMLEQMPADPDNTSHTPTLSTKTRIAQRTLSNFRMKTEEGRTLLSGSQQDFSLNIAYAMAYAKGTASDVTLTVSYDQDTLTSISVKGFTESNVGYGRVENMTLKDMSMTVEGMDIVSLDSIVFKDINLPPLAVLNRIIDAGNQSETVSEEDALNLLRDMFMSTGRPLCGEFSMNGVKISNATIDPVSIGSFRIVNSGITPFVMDISMEHLEVPLTLDPQLQTLRLAGFDNMDLTATLSFTGPDSSGAMKTSGSLNLAQGGTLDVLFEGISTVSLDGWKAFNESMPLFEGDPVGSMGVFFLDNLKVTNMEMGYADEGLLPRSIKLTQLFMGLSPEQSLELIRQRLALIAQDMNTLAPDVAVKLGSFVDHPGAIRLRIKPEKPSRLEELEANPNVSVTLDVTPGPKTIEELVNELN